MGHESQTTHSGTHGVRLLRALAEEGHVLFSAPDARKTALDIGVPERYINNLLSRMVRDGWLTRLRRGLYAREGTVPGEIQIHPFAIITHLVRPSAVSHWSALNHHDLTEQVPRVVTAFTPKKVVTPSMRGGQNGRGRGPHAWEIDSVRYEYVTVKQEYFFGIEKVWVDENSSVPITDRERTVLETFISPRMFGGIGEALGIIENHIRNLDPNKLVAYSCRYGKISVAKRLGWALERVGVPESVLEPLLKIPATGYHALDPTRPHLGPCDRRWMIQENLAGRRNP